MGKKPLNENQVKSLRKLVKDKPLHDLLLNLSVDLMLRSSDLLSLKVKDVMNESGSVKTEVKVKQKKTGKTTLNIPLSKNSIDVIKKHLVDKEQEDYIFKGQMGHFMRKPICSQQYARIINHYFSTSNLLKGSVVSRVMVYLLLTSSNSLLGSRLVVSFP